MMVMGMMKAGSVVVTLTMREMGELRAGVREFQGRGDRQGNRQQCKERGGA